MTTAINILIEEDIMGKYDTMVNCSDRKCRFNTDAVSSICVFNVITILNGKCQNREERTEKSGQRKP